MASKSYSLKDDGYPTFKKFVSGRKWIGRVCSTQLGHYLGIIGKTTFKGKTEDEAFRGVVARHCGHGSYTEMANKNSEIRAVNNQRRAEGRYAAEQMISGNFELFDKILQRIEKGSQ